MADTRPIRADSNGRDIVTGRFVAGNRLAVGNRAPRKTAIFRAALFRAISPSDFREILQALVTAAKRGESWAIRECLKYLVGNPADVELSQRLTILEMHLTEGDNR